MPSPVTQRSPEGPWQQVWENVWWLLTSLPYKEEYKSWLQLRHSINLHKGLSIIFCILCMQLSGQWTYPACIYTAVHGTYGILWLTKEALYRDASWESPCTGGSALFLFFGMAISFWCNIVILVTGGAQCQPSPCQVGVIATLFILGNWLHHSSDVQKYFVLKAKRGLITNGMFSRCRNPNYLGEMMIYGSFAGLMRPKCIFIVSNFFSILLAAPSLVVPMVSANDCVDLPLLPILVGQRQVHVSLSTMGSVYISLRLNHSLAIW